MTKNSKIIILAIIILCVVCVGIACVFLFTRAPKVDGIYFKTEPRNSYVQGQEFSLDNAVIVAMSKNKETPVNAEDVTVSGYDKNKTGEQTVTIVYGEHTLDFKVTVVPRMALTGITRDYFVGDKFDKNTGRIKVADDQAVIKSVNMSEDSVVIEGFDSTTVGTKTVTVKYGDYVDTFTVNVYTAETVELTSRPKKTNYNSHDTEFSTTGAYFTVTANNGSLVRMIEVTPDMVRNFLPSAATIDHMNSPLKQTVTINYLDWSFDFNINVKFSGVSLALLRSEELKDVDSTTATNDQKELALDALFVYADLTPTEQKMISSDVIQKLLEIGIPYGAEKFAEEAEKFSDTINLQKITETDEDTDVKRIKGKINIVAKSYEAVKADLERLEDIDVPLVDLAATLYELKEEFYFRKIGDQTIDEILSTVFEPSAIDEVTKAFKFLIELHEEFMDIPDNWAEVSPRLEGYESEVHSAVATINASDYDAFDGSATLYSILSSWRTENDYFDIIYAYYYYNDRTNLVTALWEKVYLPGSMQELFTVHNLACQEAMNIRIGDDTSTFMYYYYRSNEIAEQIKNGDNKLHVNIYNFLDFDRLINDYLFFGTKQIGQDDLKQAAYVYHASSLLGNPTYEMLLDDFFELFKLSLQEGFTFHDENVKELAVAMLNGYVAFTPNERFAFLGALHCNYRVAPPSGLVLSHTVGEDGVLTCFNYFTYLLYSSFKEVLSPEAYDVFSRLMETTEMYSLRYHNPDLFNGFTDANGVVHPGFMATMATIIEDASKLNDSDKELFASLLAEMTKVYDYENSTPSVPVLPEDQKALFDELKAAIETFYSFYALANSEDVDADDRFKYYIIAFSAFERANAIADEIRALDNPDAMYTLIYVPAFEIAGTGDSVMNVTFDYMLDQIGASFYQTALALETADGSNVCALYWNNKIANFLNDAYDVFLAIANDTIDETYLDAIRALDNAVSEKYLFNRTQVDALKALGAWDYYEAALEYLKSMTA